MAVTSEITFKRIGAGWVYRAPSPWLFSQPSHYLTNDTQKAAIMAILDKGRRVLIAGVVGLVAAGCGLAAVLVSRQGRLTVPDFLMMIALVAAATLIGSIAFAAWQQRRLRPVLAGLPYTAERISAAHIRQAALGAISLRRWIVLGSCDAIFALCAMIVLLQAVSQYGFAIRMAIVAASVAAAAGIASSLYSFRVARLRARDAIATPVGRLLAGAFPAAQWLRSAAIIGIAIATITMSADRDARSAEINSQLAGIQVRLQALQDEMKTKPVDAAEVRRRQERLDALSKELDRLSGAGQR